MAKGHWLDAWSVTSDSFPAQEGPGERLLFALRYAILAPSSHNTQPDDREAWLGAGEALDRLMLEVTAANVACSFVNQPIEVAELRPRLAQLTGSAPFPQLMLRLGYADDVPPSRRRALEDALI